MLSRLIPTRTILKIILLNIIVLFIQSCAEYDSGCYVTATGDKYHKGGCKYLHSSKIAIGCDEARYEGYSPCSVCKP